MFVAFHPESAWNDPKVLKTERRLVSSGSLWRGTAYHWGWTSVWRGWGHVYRFPPSGEVFASKRQGREQQTDDQIAAWVFASLQESTPGAAGHILLGCRWCVCARASGIQAVWGVIVALERRVQLRLWCLYDRELSYSQKLIASGIVAKQCIYCSCFTSFQSLSRTREQEFQTIADWLYSPH